MFNPTRFQAFSFTAWNVKRIKPDTANGMNSVKLKHTMRIEPKYPIILKFNPCNIFVNLAYHSFFTGF